MIEHFSLNNSEIKTIPDILNFCADNYNDMPAFSMRSKANKNKITSKSFTDLKSASLALACAFEKLGFGNQKVALIGENSIEWIEAFFALSCCESVAVALDKDLSPQELSEFIERSGCKGVLYSENYQSKIDEIKESSSQTEFISFLLFEELIEQNKSLDFTIESIDENSPALIVFTSGTTGKSKGVMLSHKNIVSDSIAGCEAVGQHKKEVLILPLHHTFGLITGVFGPLLLGANIFISKSIRRIERDMELFKPDIIFVVPIIAEAFYKKILGQIETKDKTQKIQNAVKFSDALQKIGIDKRKKFFAEILSKFGGELKTIICGGAPVSEAVINGLCSFGIETRNGYGITECSPVVCVNPLGKNKIGSVGKPLSCCKVRIKNPDENSIGEIEVQGSNVMLGYLDDEEATKNAFSDDWFKTGDIGFIDKDGYLFLTGRKKNLIILSNGKNISPEEIENELLKNELIKEVIVFDGGGNISAEIYPGENIDEETKKEIYAVIDSFNRCAPPYKNIEKIIIRTTEFPKTATMKIKRDFVCS